MFVWKTVRVSKLTLDREDSMKTKDEVTQEFLTKLKSLLREYSTEDIEATIEAEDHYPGYPECGEDIRMTVDIPSTYSPEGECLREWTEIDLGQYFTP